jgi:hypothetical protein
VESIDGALGFAQIGAAHAFSLKVIQHGRRRSERGKGALKRTDTSQSASMTKSLTRMTAIWSP